MSTFVDGVEVAQETLETEDFCDINDDHEKTKVTDFKGKIFLSVLTQSAYRAIAPSILPLAYFEINWI